MCSGKAETPGDGRGLVEAYAIFGLASTALPREPALWPKKTSAMHFVRRSQGVHVQAIV